MNFIQIVGTINELPMKIDGATSSRYSKMSVEVVSNFRENSGAYRRDVFPVYLWRGINDETVDGCKSDSIVAIKGRVECHEDTFKIIAEHIEFLRTK